MSTTTDTGAAGETIPAGLLSGPVVAGVVALVGILVGALVSLYALAPAAQKPELGPLFAAIPGVLSTVGVIVLGLWSKLTHRQTSGKLDVITRQTNGELTRRINESVSGTIPAAVMAAMAAMRAPVIPAQAGPADPSPAPTPATAPPAVDVLPVPVPAGQVTAPAAPSEPAGAVTDTGTGG